MTKVKLFFSYFFKNLTKVDITAVGGQLAYFFFLSLFPLLLFFSASISYLHINEESVYKMMAELVPHEMYDLIHGLVESLLNHQNASLLSLGILGTIWSASNGVNAIGKALDHIYNTTEPRHFIMQRIMSMVFMVFLFFLVGIVAIVGVFGRQIGVFISKRLQFDVNIFERYDIMRWGIVVLGIFVALVLLYRFLPHHKIKFRETLIGSAFTSIGWLVFSYLFSIFIDNFSNYSAIYGSIGAVIILMLWFYLSGIIVLIGGMINAAYATYRKTLLSKKQLFDVKTHE
ncbi:YihY/virulence factor BrkB family protein [Brochothrix campestris]|uniref:YihY/virulence factor BrkB family protein n=1 Tax=Brochothrix campestris TaxID=2757 RepID=UPI0038D117DE